MEIQGGNVGEGQGGSSIVIRRDEDGRRDRVRAYGVRIDGHKVGTIKRKETHTFPVPAGPHTVTLHIDWCRSPAVAVDTRGSEPARLVCGPGGSAFAAVWAVLFGRSTYIRLGTE